MDLLSALKHLEKPTRSLLCSSLLRILLQCEGMTDGTAEGVILGQLDGVVVGTILYVGTAVVGATVGVDVGAIVVTHAPNITSSGRYTAVCNINTTLTISTDTIWIQNCH